MEIVPQALAFERDLQGLVEANMPASLGVRFLASEYSSGPVHGGRIDSLGIDENGAPVVVEYKRGRDPGVTTQGLFYLAWLTDHRAEFEALVRARLGVPAASQVLRSAPRLICVAEDFTRYDRHPVGGSAAASTWSATASSAPACSALSRSSPMRPATTAREWAPVAPRACRRNS
ncbi:hypothetical protein [Streptomyces sp. NBC_01190]|uniref:hypothetical protein n=1 Tax=Streptomyces sp. NBC_01190 TaxID=2903767 RepID=UPI003868BBB1